MLRAPLRVLIVEDSDDDVRLVVRELKRGGFAPVFERVDTPDAMKSALEQKQWDIVISDYVLPHFSGPAALKAIRETGLDLPFILMSGDVAEETLVDMMKLGAHDCVMKDRLARLAPAVTRELREAKVRQARQRAQLALLESEERYRTLAESAPDLIFIIGPDARVRYVNGAAAREFGCPAEEIAGKTIQDIFPKPIADRQWHNVHSVFESGQPLYVQNHSVFPGHESWLDTWLTPVKNQQGQVQAVFGISRDVSSLLRTEASLRQSEARLRMIIEQVPAVLWTTDGELCFTSSLGSGLADLGLKPNQVKGLSLREYFRSDDPEYSPIAAHRQALAGIPAAFEFSWENRIFDSRVEPLRAHDGTIIGTIGFALDVTARRETESRYRQIFENSLDVIYVHDLQGRFTDINPAGEKLLGYTRDEVLQSTFDKIVTPDTLPLALKNLQDKIEGKATRTAYELEVFARNGERRWIELVSRILARDGRPVAVQGNARDITERKKAAAELEAGRRRYRNLITALPDAVAVHRQGRIVFINPAAVRLMGAESPEQLLGRPMLDFLHPDYRAIVLERMRQMGDEGKQVAMLEEKFVRLDGTTIDVEVMPLRVDYEDESSILVVFHDITERKNAQEAMRQSEARYRLLFEAAPIGIAVFDQAGRVLAINQMMQDLTGFTLSELRSLGVAALFVDPDERRKLTHDYPESGAIRDWETRLLRKDGSSYYALLNVDRLQFDDTMILLATARDITDRKLADQRLVRTNRLFTVLSKVSSALVRIRDQQRLCEEVCRIAVEEGGFKVAWVGLVDADTGLISLLARWGHDEGYLDQLRISMREPPGERGPTATAIREGKTVVKNDFARAPDNMPNYRLFARDGIQSAAAFPLQIRGEAVGSLTLYAGEPNRFDGDQIRLLEALAADLSFALETAGNEQLRKASEQELQESEEKFRRVFEEAPAGMALVNPGLSFVMANAVFCRMLGYSEEELKKLRVADVIHPDERAISASLASGLISGGRPGHSAQRRFVKKDGTIFLTGISASAIRDSKGNFLYGLAVVEDPAGRKPEPEPDRNGSS